MSRKQKNKQKKSILFSFQHMFWMLNDSLIGFFLAPKTNVKNNGRENIHYLSRDM